MMKFIWKIRKLSLIFNFIFQRSVKFRNSELIIGKFKFRFELEFNIRPAVIESNDTKKLCKTYSLGVRTEIHFSFWRRIWYSARMLVITGLLRSGSASIECRALCLLSAVKTRCTHWTQFPFIDLLKITNSIHSLRTVFWKSLPFILINFNSEFWTEYRLDFVSHYENR